MVIQAKITNRNVQKMNLVRYSLENIFFSMMRFIPFPTKTGLRKIGDPDKDSPVFVTGNYRLTVIRLERALKGMNCYILVSNSKGINVWCSSAGGYFTNHSVISVVKSSGIENLVDHRKLILPQLTATGIERKVIEKKIGWKVIWGPVYAKDIPHFVANHFSKSNTMKLVNFSLKERIEMAFAWAFPITIVAIFLGFVLNSKDIFQIILLIWLLSVVIFISFPFYEPILRRKNRLSSFKNYDLQLAFVQIMIWITTFFIVIEVHNYFNKSFDKSFIINWGIITFLLVMTITIDLLGNSPTYKSALSEDRLLSITLDTEKCKVAAF